LLSPLSSSLSTPKALFTVRAWQIPESQLLASNAAMFTSLHTDDSILSTLLDLDTHSEVTSRSYTEIVS
jgi:hypothetical protein